MITTDGSALSDGLGPLPDARRPDEHGMGWFTAGQMYAYGRAAYALGARSTAAQPLPESAEWEMREDGKLVRKDRWQTGMRRIVALLWGNRHEFEVDEVVEAVRALCPAPYNDGDDEGLVRAILAAAPPAAAQPVEPTVTPTEAVVGFASWVTCRPGTLPAGEGHDAAPWSEAVHEFVVAQGWPTVRDVFPHNLKRPPLSAPPAASGDSTPPSASQVDAVELEIASRYVVEKRSGGGFWPYCVRAGDGARELFVGHKKACDNVRAALESACLDGAFMARSARGRSHHG